MRPSMYSRYCVLVYVCVCMCVLCVHSIKSLDGMAQAALNARIYNIPPVNG